MLQTLLWTGPIMVLVLVLVALCEKPTIVDIDEVVGPTKTSEPPQKAAFQNIPLKVLFFGIVSQATPAKGVSTPQGHVVAVKSRQDIAPWWQLRHVSWIPPPRKRQGLPAHAPAFNL